ncbi:putative AB-hydrolase YheT [Paratrimastix pyriformis]|uniref:AB-hydrolase YheT n=1 Tax=Paratrimastix pyriformis TaxID=342808 RepID=A0ABQ8UM90_9EUKA|nr:putative AB-hydrolase YheT [Paratrimastix pyriformis]
MGVLFLAAAVVLSLLAMWVLSYLFMLVFGKTQVITTDKDIERVIREETFIPSPFSVTPIPALSAFLPTTRALGRKKTAFRPYRELITIPDGSSVLGGTVGLDWFDRKSKEDTSTICPADETPIVFVCHGVNGGSAEPYVHFLCLRARKQGWRPVCFVMRGCAGLKLTTCMTYNGAMTGDLHEALTVVCQRYPKAPVHIVGYSFGSAIVANYLGEQNAAVHPKIPQNHWPAAVPAQVVGAMLIGVPFNFITSCTTMHPFYDANILKGLKFYYNKHKAILSTRVPPEQIEKAKKCEKFDDAATSRLQGYPNAMEYYHEVSCSRYLDGVRVPTVFCNTRNDPISVPAALPDPAAIKANPALTLVTTGTGGHLGWFVARPNAPTWDENLAIRCGC